MKKNGGKANKFFAKLRQIYRRLIATETKPEKYFTDNAHLSNNKGDQPTGSKAITPSRLVIKGFVLAFLFTIIILGSLAWYTWRSNRHLKALETKHFKLLELSGQIIYLDEVLTMSAQMAAHSGESKWEKRYRKSEPQLDKAIKEVIELSPEKFMREAISRTDAANIKLVAMENRAFDLIRQEKDKEAMDLLHSREYQKQKQIYSEGITEIANEIGNREKNRLTKEQQIAFTTIIFLIIAMPLVAFIWLAALLILRRYIAERKRTEFTLRMSEQCFSAIADHSYFWEIWVNPTGRPVWTNPAVQRLTGYSIKELMAMSDFPEPLIYEQDRQRMDKAFNLALEGNMGNEVQFRLIRKDGVIIWAEASWKPIYDKENAFIGYRASIRDITDRKRAEQEVMETQERFSDFFKNAPIGFHIFGPDQIIVDINDAELEMIGYSRDEIVGKKTWAELIIPEERQQFKEHWYNIISKGQVKNLEYTLVHKDGHYINIILNASSRFDKNGNLINTRGSVLNITERKRSEQEIERIFNTTGYMICVANMEGYFKRINSSFEQTLGYSTKELLKKPFFEFIHPDDVEKTKAVIAEKLSRGVQVIGFENRYRCKDGSYKWLSWTSRPIVEEGVMYAIAYDITARKEAEQATYKLNKELEAKNKELESILYAASHDLKSPLVNIQGFGYELSKNYDLIRSALSSRTKVNNIDKAVNIALNEDIPNALDFISASSVKMDSLLSGLLDYCRLGTAVMNIRNIDMNTMMTDVSGNMEYQIKEANAEVDIEPLLPCLGDPAQISRVFTNLLTNALKFLDDSRPGKIRIYGKSQNSHSIYCVEDNGIGIAPEHHEEIFEIFYQLEPEKRTGDGLGLTIVKRIIDRHNGRIWIESEKGKGSKIFVSLPNA
ncbi:MAG: PAS domain S-box protein [Phycisphaerae bacterium]|nr:PAS domain S-box protein [Phycisphaerae bacterium]NIP55063.1 PAS domain S-box protein [Phycisphaerae bacterium]NIS53774.1 PAS domain S-box protein [Phycisphaerae bacterium]NIU11352.1 PAS domain S-box protein [Phycisphaerae bacterium]NIU57482.1 PAS domain S-box protein [Phycisphaerae bacterium]